MKNKLALAAALSIALTASVVLSAVASAAMTLPKFNGAAIIAGGVGDEAKLTVKGGAVLECKDSSGEYTVTEPSRNEGGFHLHFSECTQEGEECHSLGDEDGLILTTGEWHLVLMVKNAVDGHYFQWVLPTAGLHIECPDAVVKLLLVKGSVLAKIEQKAGTNDEFVLTLLSTATAQEFSEYENDAGTGVKVKLEATQENGLVAKPAFMNSDENDLIFLKPTAIEG
jgi:hypothetical protein